MKKFSTFLVIIITIFVIISFKAKAIEDKSCLGHCSSTTIWNYGTYSIDGGVCGPNYVDYKSKELITIPISEINSGL